MIHVISTKGLIFITLLYFVIAIDLTFTQKRYTNRIMKETIDKIICPEAYIDFNLYNAKRIICSERLYKYSLNNIAYGYWTASPLDVSSDSNGRAWYDFIRF